MNAKLSPHRYLCKAHHFLSVSVEKFSPSENFSLGLREMHYLCCNRSSMYLVATVLLLSAENVDRAIDLYQRCA